ncbi:MAG: ATP-dependent sacrificial sulfur transferase LarE [Candidatus Omnitrophica bacterium]|nr:ATP-dependent sacrificial sulfur transferase LarE [Candidatus Omnitrophota bacterium]
MDRSERLTAILKKMGSVVLAYSGGVDSSFLLKAAKDALGGDVLAVTAVSPTYSHGELQSAKKTARSLKARHLVIKTEEFNNPRFTGNPKNRCYFCKKELFGRLKRIAAKKDYRFVIDASNLDDDKDYRPGSIAGKEEGVRSPLKEAGFTKADIRRYSKKLRLPTWDMPSLACLASRFPYGRRITKAALRRVEKAEGHIRKLGFAQVRVRDYGGLARIEVDKKRLPELLTKRQTIVDKLKGLGYNYITVDLEGYRTGSMNEVKK